MNRALLKEMINNIVAHKLEEISSEKNSGNSGGKGKKPSYGYIIANKDSNDPTLQLIGYGNMSKSAWIKKLTNDINDLLKRVERGDWRNAAHIVEKDGVLYSTINMMKEIFEKDLNEQIPGVQSTDLDKAEKVEDNMSAVEKKTMDAYQNALDKITNDVRKIDADISKLQEPVRTKVDRLQNKKANLQKKQGQVVSKIDSLKKKNV